MKRLLAIFMVVLMITATFAGCSTKDETPPPTSSAPRTQKPPLETAMEKQLKLALL